MFWFVRRVRVQDAHYLNNIQMPSEMFFRTNTIQVAVQLFHQRPWLKQNGYMQIPKEMYSYKQNSEII